MTVAGYGPPPDAKCEYVEIVRPPSTRAQRGIWAVKLVSRAFESYFWNRPAIKAGLRALANRKFDLVISNDVASLPLALKIAVDAPVLADAHEYSPREFDDLLAWRLLFRPYINYICREYLPKSAALTTVCDGIASAYRDDFGVLSEVIYNAPDFVDLTPSDIHSGKVRIVHHGAAIRSRRLEVMIDVLDLLDERFTLDFMLVPSDPAYLTELQRRASSNKRVQFKSTVPVEEISRSLNGYDVGLFLLPPTNFNYEFALPNKLFEFVQARLAVAVGPSPEMARLVNAHSLGIVAESFEPQDMARALQAVSDQQLEAYKMASHAAARKLSFEESGRRLKARIDALLALKSSAL